MSDFTDFITDLVLVTGDWLGERLYWDTSELLRDREGEVFREEAG